MTLRLSLVLAVFVALCVWLTVDELDDAAEFSEVSADAKVIADRLAALRDLESALGTMRGTRQGAAFVLDLGISPETLEEFVGIDIDADYRESQTNAVRAIEQLGISSPIDVDDVRAEDPVVLTNLISATRSLRSDVTDELRSLSAEGDKGSRLQRAADRLALATELAPALEDQTFSTANLLLDQSGQAVVIRLGNAVDDQTFVRLLFDQLAASGGETAMLTGALRDADSYRDLDELTTTTIGLRISGSSADVDVSELTALSDVWRGTRTTHSRALAISDTASRELLDSSASLNDGALSSRRRSAAIGLIVLMTVAIALTWFFRSVVRPLQMLEADARRLADGKTPATTSRYRGSRELRAAGDAIGQLVESLRLIELQASKLADGQIDDPVLRQAAPGRLGVAITRTVRRLSESIASQRTLQERLEHEASHDALTGLANRRAAFAHLAQRSENGQLTTAVSIDLDGFKKVNDRFGHSVGDDVLCAVATSLAGFTGANDLAVRIGGDEFILLLGRVLEGPSADAFVHDVRRRIENAATAGTDLSALGVSASIGIAALDPDGDIDDVLRRADEAMYRAKQRRRTPIGAGELDEERWTATVPDPEPSL